jgi:autotransporter translocation and assembly factor TamB
MTTAKDAGSIILLVLLSPLAIIALLVGALFAIPVYIIGVIVAFARHDELASRNARIKVALAWPLGFWLKLKTMKAFDFLGRQVGRLSSRLKKWNAGRIRRTEKRLGK